MKLKKKSKKAELKEQADKNTTVAKKKVVAKGESEEEEVKSGVPVDHIKKHKPREKERRLIGMSKGVTKNMGDYQSLRVDCWLSDFLEEDENPIEKYQELSEVIDEQLELEVDKVLG
jgi:hypothetical protein